MSWAYAICDNADVFEKHDLQLLHLVCYQIKMISNLRSLRGICME